MVEHTYTKPIITVVHSSISEDCVNYQNAPAFLQFYAKKFQQVIARAINNGSIDYTLMVEDTYTKPIMTAHSSISEDYVNYQNAPAFLQFYAKKI